jgi:hypothetical protein
LAASKRAICVSRTARTCSPKRPEMAIVIGMSKGTVTVGVGPMVAEGAEGLAGLQAAVKQPTSMIRTGRAIPRVRSLVFVGTCLDTSFLPVHGYSVNRTVLEAQHRSAWQVSVLMTPRSSSLSSCVVRAPPGQPWRRVSPAIRLSLHCIVRRLWRPDLSSRRRILGCSGRQLRT